MQYKKINFPKVGRNIKAERIRCDISQQDLADFIGTTRQTVGRMEAGQNTYDLKDLYNICVKLHVSLEELIYR